MKKKVGDLFYSHTDAYGHGVNTQGVMGSGIAVEFKNKFPKNFVAYRNACQARLLVPGEAFIFAEHGRFVVNIASQEKTGKDARYEWLFAGALDAARQLTEKRCNTLALPLIGCGIGGLEWAGVEHLLRAVEAIVPGFEFEVWKL